MMSMMVRWGVETNPDQRAKWSTAWHMWSALFRLGTAVLWVVTLWGEWWALLCLFPVYISLCWTLWDGLIAIHLRQSFWYIGSTSKWDKYWNQRTSKAVKIVVLAITVISIVLYFCLIFKY